MEKAGAFFGASPRLERGVNDFAGVLNGSDKRSIRGSIMNFERRFPQCGFTVAFMALGKDIPGAAYAFWMFNRANQGADPGQGSRNRHLLLLVDTAARNSWMTLGYGLEPFISRKMLEGCMGAARPHFAAGKWGSGVSALLAGMELIFREVILAFPKIYGLPPFHDGGYIKNHKPAAER